MNQTKLTQKEIAFCELYVNGMIPYVGNAQKCFSEVFGEQTRTRTAAMRLLNTPHIKEYVEELEALNVDDAKRKREYLSRNLEHIIEETVSTDVYNNKGKKSSPAALRSVCVQAMKLYAELYPVKEAQVNKLSIDSNGAGITFNVIVPDATPSEEGEEEC